MPFGLGMWELAILIGILVLLFGTKGAGSAARKLGKGVREVQDSVREVDPRRLLDPPKDESPPKVAAPAQPAATRVAEPEPARPADDA